MQSTQLERLVIMNVIVEHMGWMRLAELDEASYPGNGGAKCNQ